VSITFYCTECTQKLRIDDDFAGKLVACTRCGSRLRVPALSEAAASARPRPLPPPEAAPAEVRPPEFEPAEFPPSEPALPEPEPPAAAPDAPPIPAPTLYPKKRRDEPLIRPAMKIDFEELIDMTAMVDIVFFLLIFFLVTSMEAIDSTIPMPAPDPQKAASSQPRSLSELESDNEYIVVRIDRNDTIWVNDAEVHNDRDLLFKLRDIKTSGNRPDKMLVVGNGEATHGTAVMVLDAGREVGIEQVRLAVADENE
jgi:biopolymer transport protein ExbD